MKKNAMNNKKQRVVVVGASPKPERYSNQAVRLLARHGHEVVPVHPAATDIEGIPAVSCLADVEGHVDTITLYVSGARSSALADAIIRLRPGRVIFNPGTENPALQAALNDHGIATEEACTLVLVNSGQF
ncbi:MAG: CoA-binding protein [Lentisphaeria bacterium]|nr:CoA-binding protein [Lentisphaeria bacterium]